MEQEIQRPDPDELLAESVAEQRGRLTVFLGAAAGVGKTYAMLEAARERLADGIDVVAGWVETHGRPETEALLAGIPAVPPMEVEYRGRVFREMDLDALLRRRPQIALVDELAHANVPGARHAHRYQDVEELLAAGIDVYTTLNIQHVESVNDVVAQITGVRVRHTVPDRLLEQAEIQLVDIPVEELLDRLRDGKVYLPHQAERALRKFFRPGNINALRELALRYAARRVEGQLQHYMRVHRIAGPWPVSERVMACVSSSPFSAQVIRAAKRMADGLKADLLAVHVESPDAYPGDEAARDQLARNLRLAEELGAEVITVTAADPAEALVEVARRKNVTHIVVGRPFHPHGWEIWRASLPEKVMRIASGMSVHVIPGKVTEVGRRRPAALRGYRGYPARAYVELVAAIALVTLLGWMVGPALDLSNVALLFILP
ncbi:MAG: universal stress protein, partial [Bacillota bacterium]